MAVNGHLPAHCAGSIQDGDSCARILGTRVDVFFREMHSIFWPYILYYTRIGQGFVTIFRYMVIYDIL